MDEDASRRRWYSYATSINPEGDEEQEAVTTTQEDFTDTTVSSEADVPRNDTTSSSSAVTTTAASDSSKKKKLAALLDQRVIEDDDGDGASIIGAIHGHYDGISSNDFPVKKNKKEDIGIVDPSKKMLSARQLYRRNQHQRLSARREFRRNGHIRVLPGAMAIRGMGMETHGSVWIGGGHNDISNEGIDENEASHVNHVVAELAPDESSYELKPQLVAEVIRIEMEAREREQQGLGIITEAVETEEDNEEQQRRIRRKTNLIVLFFVVAFVVAIVVLVLVATQTMEEK